MGKRRKNQNKDNRNPKRRPRREDFELKDMDDEIDAFHKQRDVVPLDVNGDVGESDEDNEHPVFDFENDDDDDDDDGEDGDIDDDAQVTGFTAKLARQQKILRAKFGGVEDEMHDDDDNQGEEDNKVGWGRRKDQYYHADNVDFEVQSSEDESLAEEEAEALRLQRKAAESLTMEDMGLENDSKDHCDRELTLEELSIKGKRISKSLEGKDAKDDMGTTFEEVKKDLNSLSREEQMDVVYSSAPELVGLLSELNGALEQLENKINPLLSKVKGVEIALEGGIRYLEVKQLLLLAYCQAITFYLLLKSEGQPVRDHPVIARLVEIKGLLDKMKERDGNLPFEFEEILNKNNGAETVMNLVPEKSESASDSVTNDHGPSVVSADKEKAAEVVRKTKAAEQAHDAIELVKVESLKDSKNKGGKHRRQDDQVCLQSMEMLKVRAALEEKLKQKGIFGSNLPKPDKVQKHPSSINGQLETFDDFDDDAINVEGGVHGSGNGHASSLRSNKLSQLVTVKQNKPKVVSGDNDLPKRDDIGERRRKHELRVLAGAGVKSEDEVGDELWTLGSDGEAGVVDGESSGSEDEFYKKAKQQREANLTAKAKIYTRTSVVLSLPETIDGKRHITSQMEKNRGLTRKRKKENKNPRKKYRSKYEDAAARHKGRVREIRKPSSSYGGESTGINAGISRSTRF